jgi:hypothetical protein
MNPAHEFEKSPEGEPSAPLWLQIILACRGFSTSPRSPMMHHGPKIFLIRFKRIALAIINLSRQQRTFLAMCCRGDTD